MMKRFNVFAKVTIAVCAILTAVCSTLFTLSDTASASASDTITNAALLRAAYACYTQVSGGIQREYTPSVDGAFKVAGPSYGSPVGVISSTAGEFVMPTNFGNTLNNRALSCYAVFNGINGLSGGGLFQRYNKNTADVTVENMGYVGSGGSSDYQCVLINYKVTYGEGLNRDKQSNHVCYPVDSSGKITDPSLVKVKPAPSGSEVGTEAAVPKAGVELLPVGNKLYLRFYRENGSTVSVTAGTTGPKPGYGGSTNITGMTIQEVADRVKKDFPSTGGLSPIKNISLDQVYYASDTDGSLSEKYVLEGRQSAVKFLEWLTGTTYGIINLTEVSDDDWATLYNEYVTQLREKKKISINTNCNASKSDNNVITFDKGATWCSVDVSGAGDSLFAGKSNTPQFGLLKLMKISDILDLLKNLNYDEVNSGTVTDPSTPSGTPAGEAAKIGACYSGTGILSWIVCPVMDAIGTAGSWLYEAVVEPALQVKSSVLFDDSNGVYSAWSTFRGFSNTLFAIAFVIVILAQVTGIGISNYNIKKILPRLIMVVVLVNISYILCQLAVDASNIVGSSIKSFFKGIQIAGAPQESPGAIVGEILNGAGLAVGAGLVGLKAMTIPVVGEWFQYLWPPLLLALIGFVIAVVFFFILLSMRQAGIVVLVALAPVAIVCYALPNTKPIFDKWKKLFTALLLVYPICGLFMGGGQFVCAMLLNAGTSVDKATGNSISGTLGFFYTIAALLSSVVPFFLIPTVLKNSMAAMGNLGVKLANFGTGLSNGINRGIKGSEMYQERQKEHARTLGIAKNKLRVDRYSNMKGKGGLIGGVRRAFGMNNNLSDRQQQRISRLQSSIDRAEGEGAAWLQLGMQNDGTADVIGDASHYGVDGSGNIISYETETVRDSNGNEITQLRRDSAGNLIAAKTARDSVFYRYLSATQALQKDPNDSAAAERQRAAASILVSTAPGRSALADANNMLGQMIDNMPKGSDDQMAARQALRSALVKLRRSNGNDISKSTYLDEQIKSFSKIIGDDGKPVDYNFNKMQEDVFHDSIRSLSKRSISEMNKRDVTRYEQARDAGLINDDDFDVLTSRMIDTMNDERYSAHIDAETGDRMAHLTNKRFNTPFGGSNPDFNRTTANIVNSGTAELARVRVALRDKQIENANQVLDNLSSTLSRAAMDDSFKISQEMAKQINETLKENGRSAADDLSVNFGLSSGEAQGRLDALTGLKIQHPPRQTLEQRHPDYHQAVMRGIDEGGVSYNAGDWVRVDAGKVYKLSPKDAREAQRWQDADIDAQRAREDEEFKARQQQNGGSS